MQRYQTFISSVQKEFANERRILSDYLRKDALLGNFFDVFVFEYLPATDNTLEKVYIEEPQRFFLTSEIKCAHFHETRVEKPIPFYQVYLRNSLSKT